MQTTFLLLHLWKPYEFDLKFIKVLNTVYKILLVLREFFFIQIL